ncbi:MAG: YceK/YidQ family lipoprotein [Myxococcota bacterium]
MIRSRPLAGLLALLVAAPGCMTLDTQLSRGYEGPYVYSGVRKDLEILGPAFLHLSFGWVTLSLLDLPLSLVADTLLLPVSISRDSVRDQKIEEKLQVRSDRPARVRAKDDEPPVETARRLFDECRELLRRQDDTVADCYSVDASITIADGSSARGSEHKLTIREAIALHRRLGISVDWREPVFEPDGERVRIRATRRSSQSADASELVLVVAPGPDGGWRIVEETGVGWPEK